MRRSPLRHQRNHYCPHKCLFIMILYCPIKCKTKQKGPLGLYLEHSWRQNRSIPNGFDIWSHSFSCLHVRSLFYSHHRPRSQAILQGLLGRNCPISPQVSGCIQQWAAVQCLSRCFKQITTKRKNHPRCQFQQKLCY